MEGKNIYQKLTEIRAELVKINLKKTGENKYSNFKYYELADFLPTISKLNEKYKIITLFLEKEDSYCLKLMNNENTEDHIEFTLPKITDQLVKGANTIQNLGAVITYSRRYLYMISYEISEPDLIDKDPIEDVPKELLCKMCKKPVKDEINTKTGEVVQAEEIYKKTKGNCKECTIKAREKNKPKPKLKEEDYEVLTDE